MTVSGLSSIAGMEGAPKAVQKQWENLVEALEEAFKEEYYTVKAQWKQDFQCAACQVAARELGEVVEELAGWSTVKPTEMAYVERFGGVCDEIERKYGIAVMQNFDQERVWYEHLPVTLDSVPRLVLRDKEPTLNTPFLRESLGTMCNLMVDSHFKTLTNLSHPTARFAMHTMCMKKLNLCNEEKVLTQLYSAPSRSDVTRFREKGNRALQAFWNVLANKTDPERSRIRCMACDVTLAHIQDEIGWRNPNVQKRQIHPSIAQLLKTCGTKQTWESWGLWYDFWSETVVVPYFLKEKNLARGAVKLHADVVPALLFDICREVAQTSKADLDGYEEPVPNCHNMPWCQATEWESDSRSENSYHTIELHRDKLTKQWTRIGNQELEPEETDEEVAEEEKREAELAARKKSEKAAKRAKAKSASKKARVDL